MKPELQLIGVTGEAIQKQATVEETVAKTFCILKKDVNCQSQESQKIHARKI